ncbi:MotA/TolQ/ExbB proton channel family protein [candidate division WOR-3 bacterium]|nr:MotA/TolQ/ExbB proton channel family protein [candidate division WOR-3 bacterium]
MLGILIKTTLGSTFISSGWIGRIVVIILFILSVWSWAVFIFKYRLYKRREKDDKDFLDILNEKLTVKQIHDISKEFNGPTTRILHKGWIAAQQSSESETIIINTKSAMKRKAAEEISELESHLPFLATIVTVSPFLGLFGTVWGIMRAFIDIKTYGSAHIMVIAPGIAESLITTAIGLCVAIPAVIFYNYLANKIRRFVDSIDNFTLEIEERMRREISKSSPIISSNSNNQ